MARLEIYLCLEICKYCCMEIYLVELVKDVNRVGGQPVGYLQSVVSLSLGSFGIV